jgi:predicted secreted protein
VINPIDGSVIRARVGETIEITLPENPTTGFIWHIDHDDGGGLVTSDFKPAGGGVGAGGTRTFRITPRRESDEHIVLSLRRPNSTQSVEERALRIDVDQSV